MPIPHCHRTDVFAGFCPVVSRPSAEPEPVRDDGRACCYPWVGAPLPCVCQAPAALSARGFLAAAERRRGGITPGLRLLSGVVETGESPECSHGPHGARTLDTTQGLKGVDPWAQPPSLPLVCACLLQARKPCGLLGHNADVFLQDNVLCWRGTDDLAEPPQVSGAPSGSAYVTDILPQEQGCELQLRSLESAAGLCTRPAQVTNGFIVHPGDVDRCQVPGAHQTSQFDSVSTIGFDPIPRLFRAPGGSDAPADMACVSERAGEPRATRASCRDTDKGRALGWQPKGAVWSILDIIGFNQS